MIMQPIRRLKCCPTVIKAAWQGHGGDGWAHVYVDIYGTDRTFVFGPFANSDHAAKFLLSDLHNGSLPEFGFDEKEQPNGNY